MYQSDIATKRRNKPCRAQHQSPTDTEVWNTVAIRKLPHFLGDNEFLLTGHRPQLNSYWACFKSVLRIHTETGNIWSHLLGISLVACSTFSFDIGCVAFVFLALKFWLAPHFDASFAQKLTFTVFFLGAITCLGLSAAYHTVSCHSETVYLRFAKLDYVGIVALIVGSFPPWLHVSFWCSFTLQSFYTILIVVLGGATVYVVVQERFSQPELRPLRAGVFCALGLSGLAPGLHYILSDDIRVTLFYASWLILMAAFYIGGAIIYALRIPERFLPGYFDLWFQSHQIFHMFVIAGALTCYHGVSIFARDIRTVKCPQ